MEQRARKASWILFAALAMSGLRRPSPAPAAEKRGAKIAAVFPCQGDDDLCIFTPGKEPSRIPIALNGQLLKGVLRLDDKRFALLLRGHQEAGSVVVASLSGDVEAVRILSNPLNLPAVVGVDKAGNVLLCGADPVSNRCDLWLPRGHFSAPRSLSDLPNACRFPTFLDSGDAVCWTETPDAALVTQHHEDQLLSRSRLPGIEGQIDQVLPFSSTGGWFLFTTQELWLKDRERSLKVSRDTISWLIPVDSGRAAFADCRITEDKVDACSVGVINTLGEVRNVWKSSTLIPLSGFSLGKGAFAIDVTDWKVREVLAFAPAGYEPRSVWKSKPAKRLPRKPPGKQ